MFGIDWERPVSICNLGDVDQIEVPFTSLHLSPQQLAKLKRSVDPLERCDDLEYHCMYQPEHISELVFNFVINQRVIFSINE